MDLKMENQNSSFKRKQKKQSNPYYQSVKVTPSKKVIEFQIKSNSQAKQQQRENMRPMLHNVITNDHLFNNSKPIKLNKTNSEYAFQQEALLVERSSSNQLNYGTNVIAPSGSTGEQPTTHHELIFNASNHNTFSSTVKLQNMT